MYSRNDIKLRGLNGSDATILLEWENDPDNWRVSNRNSPLSMLDIESLIENQNGADTIFDTDQFRWMIVESISGKLLGAIDMYETDWGNDHAYIGVLVAKVEDRGNGIGFHALEILLEILHGELDLKSVTARIQPDNIGSQRLFIKSGFKKKLEKKHSDVQDADYIEFVCELEKKWLKK